MFPNAPNKKAPPAPIKRRSRCGKRNWLPFYRPCSFAPRAFARFAGCIRDIAQRILNFFFFFSQYHERKFGESTKKKERGGQKTSNAANPPGLDNPQKIHYTTNRKGAVSCKRLAPYLRIKEIDRSAWGSNEAVISFVHFYIAIQKSSRAGRHAKKRIAALGLDNPLKIHYTTNRKGAVSYKRLAPYLRIKEIDRSAWRSNEAVISFVHFYSAALQFSMRYQKHRTGP